MNKIRGEFFMKIFKKMGLSIAMLFTSVSLVSASQIEFIVQIRNMVDKDNRMTGEVLVYESKEIIRQECISYEYANKLIEALEIPLTLDLNGIPVEVPLSTGTDKGKVIYKLIKTEYNDAKFRQNLLKLFQELKKRYYNFTIPANSDDSSSS